MSDVFWKFTLMFLGFPDIRGLVLWCGSRMDPGIGTLRDTQNGWGGASGVINSMRYTHCVRG